MLVSVYALINSRQLVKLRNNKSLCVKYRLQVNMSFIPEEATMQRVIVIAILIGLSGLFFSFIQSI